MFNQGDKVRSPSTGAVGVIIDTRAVPPGATEYLVETTYESAYQGRQKTAHTWWPASYLEAYKEEEGA